MEMIPSSLWPIHSIVGLYSDPPVVAELFARNKGEGGTKRDASSSSLPTTPLIKLKVRAQPQQQPLNQRYIAARHITGGEGERVAGRFFNDSSAAAVFDILCNGGVFNKCALT